MSENQNRRTGDLSRYDAMTTEELESILRLDSVAPAGQESDTEEILYIMEVLAQRNKQYGHTGKTALEAYESFQQNYMPETDHRIPVKTHGRMPRWARSLTAAAAVLAILLVGSVTAKAFGFNLWRTVIQWTQETFHFGAWGNSDSKSKLAYDSLQEALEQGEITTPLAPTWLPDGYELEDITIEQSPSKKKYTAKYTNEEKVFVITIRDYANKSPVYSEQSDGLVEEYKVLEITYYLFANLEDCRAAWVQESYECDISGDVSIEELKEMINSIQKG